VNMLSISMEAAVGSSVIADVGRASEAGGSTWTGSVSIGSGSTGFCLARASA
jgi:hypothetical protein